jgi:predicted double-glycine peptidase
LIDWRIDQRINESTNQQTMPFTRRQRLALGLAAATCGTLGAAADVGAEQKPPVRTPIRDEQHEFRRYAHSWLEIRNHNVVMQQRDYSCGAAALATLIRYHWGDDVTEEQLLKEVVEMLTVEEMKERIKNGLSLTDLRKLAVRVGYQSTIGKLSFDKLKDSKVPLIVGLVVNEFDHFVVYRGTDGYYVYLADPARGNVRTPIPEFLEQWQKNAVLVVVKPGVDPKKTSPLNLQPEETFLGELNRLYVRDRLSALPPRYE